MSNLALVYEGQKLHENLAPVLVIICRKSLVFSRKSITSTGFYWYCAPGASAPVVVVNESPTQHQQKTVIVTELFLCFQGTAAPIITLLRITEKGGLSLRGVAFMTVLAVLTVWRFCRAPCPPFACPVKKNSTMRQPWRF